MLNDIKIPPSTDPNAPAIAKPPTLTTGQPSPAAAVDAAHVPKEPGVKPHEHIHPHVDPTQPGLHKTRVMGEPTRIDPIYATPMEDRGSFFSLTLSAVVVGVFGIMLLILWLSLR